MKEESTRVSHDVSTFKKSESMYDWIKSMEKCVDLGLLSKEVMEKAIQDNLKQK